MNTGQMLLTVGALVLFGTVSLGINRALLDADAAGVQARVAAAAVALAQGRVETHAAAPYDSLGIGQIEADSVATALAVFRCTTRVDYVDAASLDSVVAGPTRLKRVRVSAASDYLPSSISLAAVVGQY